MKTLKEHLTAEYQLGTIVYERMYPNSLSIIQRKSIYFTELFSINSFHVQKNYLGKILSDDEMTKYYTLKSPEDKTLLFESRFESGNLRLCIKKSDTEYNLYMQNDINTQGNVQWFYFCVRNTQKNQIIHFITNNIVIFFIFF